MKERDTLTRAQDDVLRFFLGPAHGIKTKTEASERIEELFAVPGNEQRWEDEKRDLPPTEKQIEKLKWASERTGRSLPPHLNRITASQLMDNWFTDSALQNEWEERKILKEYGYEDILLPLERDAPNVGIR